MCRASRIVVVCCVLVLMSPVLVCAQKVKVDFDKGIDFARFKTFTWGELYPARLPLLRLNIIGAINEQLIAKGLVEAPKDGDIIVTYSGDMAGESNQGVSAPAYPGFSGPSPSVDATMWTGSTGSGGGGMSPTYPKGTLIVELMDPRAAKITWRAVGQVKLDIEKKGKSVERINDMITKMFVQYPPQKK